MEKQNEVNKILISFFLKQWWIFASLFVALVLSGFLEVFPVKFMQETIDRIIQGGNLREILYLIFLWYSFRLVGCFSNYAADLLGGYVGVNIGTEIRSMIFSRISSASIKDIERASASETVSRVFNDIPDLGLLIIKPMVIIGRSLFIFLWAFVLLLQLNYVLLIACLPLGGIMLVVSRWVSKRNKTAWGKQKEFNSVAVGSVLEALTAWREISVFNLWHLQRKTFDETNKKLAESQKGTTHLVGSLDNLTQALWPVATVVCLGLGAYQVSTGDLSPGELIAFMWYIQWVIHPISQLTNYIAQVQQSYVAAGRISAVLSWFPSAYKPQTSKQFEKIIQLQGVSYRYGADRDILRDVNLSIKRGERIALVGATGSGKSTLLKIMLGLIEPQNGSMFLDGDSTDNSSLLGVDWMAAVFQDSYLFNASIRENVLLGASGHSQAHLLNILEDAEVTQFLPTLPDGIETVIGERAYNLSTGQKQRVAIARALARRPRLLVLDEATSALDSATENKIYKAIFTNYPQMTCIIVSHRLSSIIGADEIFVLKEGQLISAGTHDTLLHTCSEYRALYQSQIGLKDAL